MRCCVKWGGLLALLLASVGVLGAEYPYQVVKISSTHSVVRIQNTTGGAIPSVLVVFDDAVVVDKALAYGPGAPAVAGITGAGREWRVTLAGKGLPSGAWLDIAFKAGNVPVKFVGPGDYALFTYANDTDANLQSVLIVFDDCVTVDHAVTFGPNAPKVSAIVGECKEWRVSLGGDGLAPKGLIGFLYKAPTVGVSFVGDGQYKVLEVPNNTGMLLSDAVVLFDAWAKPEKAFVFGAPDRTTYSAFGEHYVWRITTLGAGVQPGGSFGLLYKGDATPAVRFVGPASYSIRIFQNEGEAAARVIGFIFKAPVTVIEGFVLGADDSAVLAINGRGTGWRVSLQDPHLAPGALLALVVLDGTAGLSTAFPAGIVAAR